MKTESATLNQIIQTWRASVIKSPGPIRLSEFASHCMKLSESLIAHESAIHLAQGLKASCRKGCGHCCNHVVPISPPEAFYLVGLLELDPLSSNLKRTWVDEVLQRFENNLSQLSSVNLESGYFNWAEKYFSLQMPCPFLIENSCSIYSNRPHACREHLVFSKPEDCKNINSHLVQVMHMPISIREALASLTAEVLGTNQEMIPMIQMMAWVEDNQAVDSRDFDPKYLADLLVDKIIAQI